MRDDLTEADTLARLELGLRRMPKRRREIFLAVQVEGMAYEAIAERTGISVAEGEQHFAEALVQLHETLHGGAPVSRRRRLCRWLAAMIGR